MNFLKKTTNLSTLDSVLFFLTEKRIGYQLSTIDIVIGRGINDLIPYREERKKYYIRKLKFKEHILLEQMIQSQDIELDDFLVSYAFDDTHYIGDWKSKVIKC